MRFRKPIDDADRGGIMLTSDDGIDPVGHEEDAPILTYSLEPVKRRVHEGESECRLLGRVERA